MLIWWLISVFPNTFRILVSYIVSRGVVFIYLNIQFSNTMLLEREYEKPVNV